MNPPWGLNGIRLRFCTCIWRFAPCPDPASGLRAVQYFVELSAGSHQPGPFVHLRSGRGMNRDSWLTVEQAEILAEELTLLISELESDISRLVNLEYERLTKHLLPGVPKR
jgi:hypothetical protein